MLRSGISNDRLEAVPQLVSTKSMNALVQKGEAEWGCIFTMAKGNLALHMGEAKKQLVEIQQILDNYSDVFEEISKGQPSSRV